MRQAGLGLPWPTDFLVGRARLQAKYRGWTGLGEGGRHTAKFNPFFASGIQMPRIRREHFPMTDDAKPQLQPANENPWYCLATVYGEQDKTTSQPMARFDEALDKKNRVAWNRWIAFALWDEQRARIDPEGFRRVGA
jgi:hypothetical protein